MVRCHVSLLIAWCRNGRIGATASSAFTAEPVTFSSHRIVTASLVLDCPKRNLVPAPNAVPIAKSQSGLPGPNVRKLLAAATERNNEVEA